MLACEKIVAIGAAALACATVPRVAAACQLGWDSTHQHYYSAIATDWNSHSGILGSCVSDAKPDDVDDSNGDGVYQAFQYGTIDWNGSSSYPAYEVNGLIATAWNNLGGAYYYGQPTTDETDTGNTNDGNGKYNYFYNALTGISGAIYWHNDGASAAYELHGAILGLFRESGGTIRNPLDGYNDDPYETIGFPTSNEYSPSKMCGGSNNPPLSGERRNDFDEGYICWAPASSQYPNGSHIVFQNQGLCTYVFGAYAGNSPNCN